MSSIEQNRRFYDAYPWSRGGDEWARDWNTTEMQWWGSIFPRIRRYLPATTIVEIGAGYGRWSAFLRAHGERLVLVDISPRCIEACRERFHGCDDVDVRLTEGRTLPGVGNGEAGFVFSFFSLVHADVDTLQCYLDEIRRVLSPDGVAFLHHSNLGERDEAPTAEPLPLGKEYRDPTVSADGVRTLARQVGLCCPVQEIVAWEERRGLTDCFSVLAWPQSNLSRREQRFVNTDFPLEKRYLSAIEQNYFGLIRSPGIGGPRRGAPAGRAAAEMRQ